jgi:hypothetical protein
MYRMLALIMLVLAAHCTDADAVTLCRKKTKIIARDGACKGKEVQVTLNDLGSCRP